MDQVLMRFEADYDVVLECIQEVYGLEGDNLRLGKDFRKTMALPFMKMLERHCGGIQMENLHKVLWEVYQSWSPLESTTGRSLCAFKRSRKESKSLPAWQKFS